MSHLIDYAGLFPPANLPLEPAIRYYAAYQNSKDSWMLGRFIIPAARINELDRYVSLFTPERPLHCAVVGSKSSDKWDCLQTIGADLDTTLSFCERHGDSVKVDVLEFALPPIVPDEGLLKIIGVKTAKRGMVAFCEIPLLSSSDWRRYLEETLNAIAQHNESNDSVLGFKLRTGGVTANAFPTPEQVAAALIGCRDRGIPMKFTAGLHHPIRMYRAEVETKMYGFVNVFTAGMLAHKHHLTLLETEQILTEEEASHFSFTAEGLAWKDKSILLSDIDKLRATQLRSYGSCSFDEPREDLQALQIL
ncbi:hypothetical protein [Ammoniphilus sp. 3BR4]|uniref:hypothetical protein n=1 Tax=Ammoniphilus sp. 3BR4 TaxID=3158265 RepID=UPI0034655C3C